MIVDALNLFFMLVFAHLLADFPLQGDFLAKAKNPYTAIEGVPWKTALAAHAAIHAEFVWFLTGSWELGAVEFFAHAGIDDMKSRKVFGFNVDQSLHLACKALYIILIISMGEL